VTVRGSRSIWTSSIDKSMASELINAGIGRGVLQRVRPEKLREHHFDRTISGGIQAGHRGTIVGPRSPAALAVIAGPERTTGRPLRSSDAAVVADMKKRDLNPFPSAITQPRNTLTRIRCLGTGSSVPTPDKPTPSSCCSDLIALGAMSALEEAACEDFRRHLRISRIDDISFAFLDVPALYDHSAVLGSGWGNGPPSRHLGPGLAEAELKRRRTRCAPTMETELVPAQSDHHC